MEIKGMIHQTHFNDFIIEKDDGDWIRITISKKLMPEMMTLINTLPKLVKGKSRIVLQLIDPEGVITAEIAKKKRGRPKKWDKPVIA